MKHLIVGFCGSMGKRRVRCLKSLGRRKIYGYDTSDRAKSVADELKIELIEDITDFNNGIVIISTPPKNHMEYIDTFITQNCHVFCEASVVPSDRHMYKSIARRSIERNLTLFPSATIKFKDSVCFIKQSIDDGQIGNILSYDYRFAQNLRTWHPYQDICDFYVSDPASGAGREMTAFELSWLTWLFGLDCSILGATVSKISEISESTGIDDFYNFIIKHNYNNSSTIGSVAIDVFSHRPYRVLRIAGTKGNIEFDWIENRVTVYNSKNRAIEEYSEMETKVQEGYTKFSTEKMYIEEIRNFIESIDNKSVSKCDISDDYKVLALVEEIERRNHK